MNGDNNLPKEDSKFDDNLLGLPRSVIDAALANTAERVKSFVISDANSNVYMYGGSVMRTLIAFAAGRGVGWAMDVSGDEATMIGGIAAVFGVLGWSMLQKKWAAWRTHQAAKASAAASAQATMMTGTPTVVSLEPQPAKI